ncbi:MAG TPA: ACP S-malonyltransferase [Acidimicrobiales bacterium]|nr:ACP S-malonyltransferase [Acidimicrobiales bacterium]
MLGRAVLFPGQGTQVPRMGEPWRAHPAWEVVERAEAAVGEPLADLLLEADEDRLARTREAQLGVMLVSLMAWEAVRESVDELVAVAGHSLGQVTALVATGALSLEDGVRLAARRAELTQEAADRTGGRMAALVGADLEQAEEACRPPAGAEQACWVANDNAPGQVVVGGTPEGLEAASERAKELGVRRVLPLNVGGAFHTPLMAAARAGLEPVLAETPFAAPTWPVVSNVDARPYDDGEGWPARLADHLVQPVRWRQTMESLVDLGSESFLEVGPGAVLGGLARRTVPGREVRGVSVPDDVPPLMEVA